MMAMAADSSKTVLVVDDDPSVADLIAALLESEGYYPILAKDGDQALQTAYEVKPDAITLDLDMPGLDGRGMLRRLRADAATREVPVVVVSANSDILSHQERGQVVHTLGKPFLLPELVDAVSTAVGRG